MQIKAEHVKQRMEKLVEERIALLSNLNAYNGAIEDCQFWLNVLAHEEPSGNDKAKEEASRNGEAGAKNG